MAGLNTVLDYLSFVVILFFFIRRFFPPRLISRTLFAMHFVFWSKLYVATLPVLHTYYIDYVSNVKILSISLVILMYCEDVRWIVRKFWREENSGIELLTKLTTYIFKIIFQYVFCKRFLFTVSFSGLSLIEQNVLK